MKNKIIGYAASLVMILFGICLFMWVGINLLSMGRGEIKIESGESIAGWWVTIIPLGGASIFIGASILVNMIESKGK